jgi:hypothetical protein
MDPYTYLYPFVLIGLLGILPERILVELNFYLSVLQCCTVNARVLVLVRLVYQ